MTPPVSTEALVAALSAWILNRWPTTLWQAEARAKGLVAGPLAPLLAAHQQVTAERDEYAEYIIDLECQATRDTSELARLRAEGEAKDRALDAFASMLSDREEMAHDALQVGGLVPLDPEFEVEVPLSLLYAARTALAARAATARQGASHGA